MTRPSALLRTAALASACCALLAACKADPMAAISAHAARAEARAAGAGDFSDTHALLALADRIAASGDHAAAIPLYRRANEARPRAPEPLLGLGRSLAALGQYVPARAAYEGAVGRDKNNPQALAGLGNILIQMDRTEDALPFLDNALALAPALPEALRGKATALDLLGRHDEALAIYAEALAAAPGDIRTLNNYGLSLALHGAVDDGIRVLEDALRKPGAGAVLRQNLALAYLLRGRDAEARALVAIDTGHAGADSSLRALYTVTALAPASRLAALIQSGRRTTPAAPEGLNARQVAALRVTGADRVTVAALPAAAAPVTSAAPAAMTAAPVASAPAAAAVAAPAIAAAPAPAGVKAPVAAALKSWTVQLAAYRKETQLSSGWSILAARHADLLADLAPQRTEVNFGDGASRKAPQGIYYRLNAGPLPTRAAARKLCTELQARGASCIVRAGAAAPLQMADAS